MSVDPRFFTLVPHTAGTLADLIGAELRGSPDTLIDGAAPFAEAQAGDITFLRGEAGDARPHAGAIVVTQSALADKLGSAVVTLVVDNPRLAFAWALTRLVPDTTPGNVMPADAASGLYRNCDIGPGVMLGMDVTIGDGTSIGAGTVIHKGVQIGRNCHIEANAVLSHCRIGDDVTVQSGAVIGSAGFGFEITDDGPVPLPHVGCVAIGNSVLIGAGSCIDRGTLGQTRIGDQAMLDNLVHVAHNCEIGARAVLTAQIGLAGGAVIGEGAMIGGQAGIGPSTRVGKGAVVMAQSGVTKDVEDGATVAGFPASDAREMWRERAALRRLLAKSGRKDN